MNDVYAPGVCNIGPAEIARRRRVGHTGAVATLAVLAFLLAIDANPAWRLSIVLPASVATAGYLQAVLRFCADFGFRGVYNFGELGSTERVMAEEARAHDRRRALLISLASLGIGLVVALLSLLL
jgi:hypothetical protein